MRKRAGRRVVVYHTPDLRNIPLLDYGTGGTIRQYDQTRPGIQIAITSARSLVVEVPFIILKRVLRPLVVFPAHYALPSE